MGKEKSKLIIGISSRALFDLDESHEIYKKEGIHVAHFVIDGAIDTAFIKETFPDIYALKEKDGILQPEAIAEAYWFVHTQHRSAWTHELDLRPYMEKF